MSKHNNLSRCLVALEQDATLIAVVEMGQASWLVAGIVPGLDRYPLKKLGADRDALLQLLHRWRSEAAKAGHAIDRIAVATRRVATASGWRAGCAPSRSKPM
jgi:transposase